jgi:hypothetical protein
LLKYLDSLLEWIAPEKQVKAAIKDTSWHMLRDLLHSDSLNKYRPQEIAIAVIYFTLICYDISVPYEKNAEKKWWQVKPTII